MKLLLCIVVSCLLACASAMVPPVFASGGPCSASPCKNGGVCFPSACDPGGFYCECPPGYTEPTCVDIDLCRVYSPCKNGGRCSLDCSSTGFNCQCPQGFSGPTCSDIQKRDPCQAQPCKNGGACRQDGSAAGFSCNCPANFVGPTCADRDECQLKPCKNGGVCARANTATGFSCTCAGMFGGPTCADKCPQGFTYLESSYTCFKLQTKKMNWRDAGLTCAGLNSQAHLAVMNNRLELDAIANQLNTQSKGDIQASDCRTRWGWFILWTALQRMNPDTQSDFLWRILAADGRPTTQLLADSTLWHRGEPNGGAQESCGMLSSSGENPTYWRFADYSCATEACSLCVIH